VLGQVSSEAGDGLGAAFFGGEDHLPGVEVGEDADVVLALGRGGLIHPDPAHARAVQLVAGGGHVVFHHSPDPGVVLAGYLRDLRHRHHRSEAAHQRLATTA
jgi:hypothetical protein